MKIKIVHTRDSLNIHTIIFSVFSFISGNDVVSGFMLLKQTTNNLLEIQIDLLSTAMQHFTRFVLFLF